MHDNDFWLSLDFIGEIIQKIFIFEGKYPTEEDLPVLELMVKHMWYGAQNIDTKISWGEYYKESQLDVFDPHLEFVNFEDIPDWDNGESIYIPMFDGQTISR